MYKSKTLFLLECDLSESYLFFAFLNYNFLLFYIQKKKEKIQQSVNSMITKGEQRLLRERGEDYKKHVETNYYQAGYGNLMHIVFNCIGIL